MKRVLLSLTIGSLLVTLSGCQQAQQAIDAVGKAKTFSEDLQKNASKKFQEALPTFAKKQEEGKSGGSGDNGKEDNEKDKED
jgi:hypothetical protein